MVIQLGRLLPAASSDLPESIKTGRLPGSRSSRRSLIWSCTGWGLQCHPGHPGCGELLPRHFTLTPRSGAVYFLLHFPWGRPRSSLATTLPCGARTFLRTTPRRGRRPFCLLRQVSIVAYFLWPVKAGLCWSSAFHGPWSLHRSFKGPVTCPMSRSLLMPKRVSEKS